MIGFARISVVGIVADVVMGPLLAVAVYDIAHRACGYRVLWSRRWVRRRRISREQRLAVNCDLSDWLARYGVDLSDGPVVSAARGTGRRPETGDATRPGQLSTTRAALERQIVGALRCCIDAHGPITKERLGSASKRVAGAVTAGEAEPMVPASELERLRARLRDCEDECKGWAERWWRRHG